MHSKDTDLAAMRQHIQDLKDKLKQNLKNGESFSNVNHLYFEIKQAECQLAGMEWNIQPRQDYTNLRHMPASAPNYSHIEREFPLL